MDQLELTRQFLARTGGEVVPIRAKAKVPYTNDWWNNGIGSDQLDEYLVANPDGNLGILLGRPQSRLVDVDLDHPISRALGDRFLPPTRAIFGRGSSPRSHYLYRVSGAMPKSHERFAKVRNRKDESSEVPTELDDKGMYVEVRGSTHQSVIPPSIHPSGESVRWAICDEPSEASWDQLTRAAGVIATASWMAIHWYSWWGSIHDIVLAFAGGALRSGMDEEIVAQIVEVVCDHVGDSGTALQVRAVHDTADKLRQNVEVTGWTRLAEILGYGNVATIRKWLQLSLDDVQFHKSDLYNKNIFLDIHGKDVRYSVSDQQWAEWNGVYWEFTDSKGIFKRAEDIGERIKRNAMLVMDTDTRNAMSKWGVAASNLSRMSAALELSKDERELRVFQGEWDQNPLLFTVRNGTYDLERMQFRDSVRDDLITKQAAVVYDPHARAPRFERFMEEIMPDPATRDYIQRILGYSLTGLTHEQKFWLAYGPQAANGKSTLINVITRLMGDYAQVSPYTSFTIAAKGLGNTRVRQDLNIMQGRRFVSVMEPDKGMLLDLPTIKSLTGDDSIRSRMLYATKEEEWRPQLKLWMNTNQLPRTDNMDEGGWRRMELITFEQTFMDSPYKDALLPAKLWTEAAGIFNWVLEGYRLWTERGLSQVPRSVSDWSRGFRDTADTVGSFIEEELVWSGPDAVSRTALYEAYKHWCQELSASPVNASEFKNAVIRASEGRITEVKRNGKRMLKGVKLADSAIFSELELTGVQGRG